MSRPYKTLTDLQRDAALILRERMPRIDVAQALESSESTIWRIEQDPAVAERVRRRRIRRARGAPPPVPADVMTGSPEKGDDAVLIADTALRKGLQALLDGDPALAQAHIKAGLAVGDFAELVRVLKVGREEPTHGLLNEGRTGEASCI